MDDIIKEFLAATQEDLNRIEDQLRAIQAGEAVSEEALNELSSSICAIKHRAASAEFRKTEALADGAHVLIDEISLVREPPPPVVLSSIQQCISAIDENLKSISTTSKESERDYADLLDSLRDLVVGHSAATPPSDLQADSPRSTDANRPTEFALVNESLDLTLNDIAALLMQLDEQNTEGAGTLSQALVRLVDCRTFRPDDEAVARLAADKLDQLGRGEAPDPDAALAEIGSLITTLTQEEDGRESEIPQQAAPALDLTFSLPADADLDLLSEFVTESKELINEAESALLSLEIDPENAEAVNTVFRGFHTVKGTSGFLGLPVVSELAHRAESLLSRVRNHEIRFEGGYADLALRSVDVLKSLVEQVEGGASGKAMELPDGVAELLDLLDRSEQQPPPLIDEEATPSAGLRIGDILVASRKVDRQKIDEVAASKGEEPLGVALVKSKAATLADVAKALRTQQRMAAGERSTESTVRVRMERLDKLIDMVGELVIAQSMVAQDSIVLQGNHHDLAKKVSHASKIVRELQDLSMSMRMVPFRATFQRVTRVVRDLARKSRKQIDFQTLGEETEIDRNMVDLITDPLIHMVRNAVDHGIELPEERSFSDKPDVGTIRLSAYHSGGNVVVELEDDGRGLDREKIVKKAMETGLLESDMGLSDNDIYSLLFAPGFSTATEITDVSGRGVGLDVVKRNVEALRGRIEVVSTLGEGCKFSLRLPLTLAITDGMLVRVGSEHYIVPTVSIHLSFRPSSSALSTVAGKGDLVMLRGEIMPLFRLHRLFDIKDAIEDPTRGLLVVVGDGNRRCALLVDELLGQQQVVAKSLGRGLGKIHGVSGGAILGDGKVGLILDTLEIAALARMIGTGTDRTEAEVSPAARAI